MKNKDLIVLRVYTLDVSQKEFGELMGFSLSTIKSWESGRRNPKPEALKEMYRKTKQISVERGISINYP